MKAKVLFSNLVIAVFLMYSGGFLAFGYCNPTTGLPSITGFSVHSPNIRIPGYSQGFHAASFWAGWTGAPYEDLVDLNHLSVNSYVMKPGSQYIFDLQSSDLNMAVGIWIDLNVDGDFDDAGEMVTVVTFTSNMTSNQLSIPVTIPSFASYGYTRMRVRTRYDGSSNPALAANQSCGAVEIGHATDYPVFMDNYCWLPNGSLDNPHGLTSFSFSGLSKNVPILPHTYYHPFQNPNAGQKAVVVAGSSNILSIQCGDPSATNLMYGLFIDFNNNNSFDDPGDFLAGGEFYFQQGIIISIPNSNAVIGDHRARIRTNKGYQIIGTSMACSGQQNADNVTIDFTVQIVRSHGTLTAGNQNLCAPGNPANITFGILPTPTGTKPYKYQWYSAPGLVSLPADNSITGWTAIHGATGTSYDPPAGLNISTTYACRWGSASADDFWAANPRQVRINGKGCTASRMAVAEGAISEEMETDILSGLSQNAPNPFSGETTLSIHLPAQSQSATLEILAVDGRRILQIAVNGTGKQELILSRKQFPSAGIYLYALVVDGQIRATKRMVVTD